MTGDGSGLRRPNVLLIPVAYKNQNSAHRFCEQLVAANVDGVEVCLADNSPASAAEVPQPLSSFGVYRFPHNPGYVGAPRLVLSALVADRGPLSVDAVVICNTDLEFSIDDLVETVERHRAATGNTRWVLAPDIYEDGVQKNPNMLAAPGLSSTVRNRSLSSGFPLALAYRWLSRRRSEARSDVPTTADTMFAPHGSLMIFGSGYFTAGGSFHEGPLFNEELAIGKMAQAAGVPVRFAPELVVTHVGEETTGSYYSRRRYQSTSASWKFFRNWQPEFSLGLMSTWFQSGQDSSNRTER